MEKGKEKGWKQTAAGNLNRFLDERDNNDREAARVRQEILDNRLSIRNWKVLGCITLGVIMVVAIGIIFGILPAALLGGGMAVGISLGWVLLSNNQVAPREDFNFFTPQPY